LTQLITQPVGFESGIGLKSGQRSTAVLIALTLVASLVSTLVQPVTAAQATHLSLDAPSSIHLGDELVVTTILTDSTGSPLGGLWVSWYLDGHLYGNGTTSSDGSLLFGIGGWQPPLGDNTVSVSFSGNSSYLPSNATAVIEVLPPSAVTYSTTTATTTLPGPVVELSPSDGPTVCPNYVRGNDSGGVWNQSTLTCTLAGGRNVYPAFCVSASPGGCTVSTIGRLVIDKNVTVLIDERGGMAIYSEVDNYGTLITDMVNYGIVQNHGTIDLNGTNQLLNLPYNGLGLVNNTQGATITNWYYITNAGVFDNFGTINNYGQFITQECSPCITGTLVNDGTYVGSAPAPVYSTTVNLTGGNGTADQNSTAGVTVKITGATGDNVTVSTQVQGSNAPPGLGSVLLGSTSYYDILISGTTTGVAEVCITSEAVNSTAGLIEYWEGGAWTAAANQTVSGSLPPFTYCGDIPVSALVGTPLAIGAPSGTSVNTGSTTGTTTEPTTSQATSATTATDTTTIQDTHGSTSSSASSATPGPLSASWTGTLAAAVVILLAVGIAAIVIIRKRSLARP